RRRQPEFRKSRFLQCNVSRADHLRSWEMRWKIRRFPSRGVDGNNRRDLPGITYQYELAPLHLPCFVNEEDIERRNVGDKTPLRRRSNDDAAAFRNLIYMCDLANTSVRSLHRAALRQKPIRTKVPIMRKAPAQVIRLSDGLSGYRDTKIISLKFLGES